MAEIGTGLLLLFGARTGDREADTRYLAGKCVNLRIFEDSTGKMNLSVKDVGGSVLVVSQFTLYGATGKGRRPSFTEALPPPEAEALYQAFVHYLREAGIQTVTGIFGAKMAVELINWGPVTFVLESNQ